MSKHKKFFQVQPQPTSVSAALLFVRVVMGLAFMMHGWMKIQHPFSWMPPEAPVPGLLQFLAAISEFGGGLSLIIGFMTSLGALGIAFTMLVATSMHAFQFGDPFVSPTGGRAFELPLLFLSLAVLFVVNGAGKFSIDAQVFGQKRK